MSATPICPHGRRAGRACPHCLGFSRSAPINRSGDQVGTKVRDQVPPPPGGWCLEVVDHFRAPVSHFFPELQRGEALSIKAVCGARCMFRRRPKTGELSTRCVKCEAIVTRAEGETR